jgi:hypothetical protein
MRNKLNEFTFTTRNPSGAPGDLGTCEVGFYRLDDDLVSLVEGDGEALRSANGERITARIRPGEGARAVASRLALAHWRTQRDASEAVPGFNRPIHQAPPYGGY